ncbi:MAG: hypothetical protein K2Z80_13055 [Xanthobacteraceae bacterium]|nr:hypothetical protein [Xanthobacteraceae bacterium]
MQKCDFTKIVSASRSRNFCVPRVLYPGARDFVSRTARMMIFRMSGSKISTGIALASLALVFSLGNSPTCAAKKDDPSCIKKHNGCNARCDRVFEKKDRIEACKIRCERAFMNCEEPRSKDGKLEQVDPSLPPHVPKGKPLQDGGLLDTSRPNFMPTSPAATGTRAPASSPQQIR